MSTVRVINGSYRGQKVVNVTFTLIKPFVVGARGGYVTVASDGYFGSEHDIVRIKLNSIEDIELTDSTGSTVVAVERTVAPVESEEQAIARIRERFEILTEMTKAATAGAIRSMIVSGPPGVGKSFGVEQEIEKACLFDKLAGKRLRAEVVKGSATPIGLYQVLYKYSDANCVLVFDDCDSIFFDDVSLNLLKSALDTGKKRKISWLSESGVLRREGIPDSFEFKGSVIFITNLKFSKVKGKLKEHIEALQSRSHFVDLTIDTDRDKMLRIKQIVNDGMLDEYDFEPGSAEELVNFVETNVTKLRELSLRTILKAADLKKAFPDTWQRYASTSLFKQD